ncbi:MAG TPA: M20/M25/M40 family metallo-hydrolase [Candidatus Angelobacter sp.]|nr:M20/M25/M40 family metallo-hydrolase [Candidatus Angelobacter sp.]
MRNFCCNMGWSLIFMVFAALLPAQQKNASSNDSIRAYIAQHRSAILQEFNTFLALPNVASDEANIQKNADALAQMLQKRGLKTQLLRVEHAPSVVLAEMSVDPSKRTVTFYAHYDGQPVDKSQWKQDPWKPTLVGKNPNDANPSPDDPETRIYARSSSDDKASVFGLITALDAMQASHLPLSVNLRFFFEGEEEAGSPHLAAILSKYAGQLQSDLWVICDGPANQNGAPQLIFGSRGVVTVQITAFGPSRPLHSGHYGNWAPNPIVELAYMISKLRTTEGEITIPNFYAPVRALTPGEQQALKNVPNIDDQLSKEFGLGRTEGHSPLAEQILKPGLNLDRIEGGGTGPNPANAIPASATAYIDLRLVPNQTPEIVRGQLESYLHDLGYFVTERPPTVSERLKHPRLLQVTWGAGYPPQRTAIDAPVSQAFIQAAKTVTGDALVLMPTIGGSTPSSVFEQQFKKPVIGLPIANYDNNQHAANENLKLKNLWDGIALYAGIYGRLGEYWK